mmetsp:Transcript_11031/g.22802  ORF Transcript_11031/g.22802 Transcript_11031/m.22802 type:complete len:264 (+) Transcript_11031:283-1074(+)
MQLSSAVGHDTLEIAHAHVVPWIAFPSRIGSGTYPSEEQVLVLRLPSSLQLRNDAYAIDSRRRFCPSELGQGRHDVPERPREVRGAAWLDGRGPPSHGGRPDAALVHAPLVAGKPSRRVEEEVAVAAFQVRSVVGGKEDQRVLVNAESLQALHEVSDHPVQIRDDRGVVLLNVWPRLISVLQIRGHWCPLLRSFRRIPPAAGVRNGVAEVEEERLGLLGGRLQPRHSCIVEDVDGVVVQLRVLHTQPSALLPLVARQREVQLR